MREENLTSQLDALERKVAAGEDVMAAKRLLVDLLKTEWARARESEFSQVLARSASILALQCGDQEALAYLESLLDELSDAGIVSEQLYADIVESTACARWL